MADQRFYVLLQLPCDGRSGDIFYRHHVARHGGSGLREALRSEMAAMDLDGLSAVSVYRQYSRMDDGGVRPPTLGHLQLDADCGRILRARFYRQCRIYALRIYGNVCLPLRSVSVPDVSHH